MTHLLPPNLLRLFVPRPPLSVVDALPEDTDPAAPPRRSKKIRPLQGVAAILERVKQEAADKGEATEVEEELTYTEQTKREMRREEKKKAVLEARKRGEETFDPSKDPEAQGDPFTTLFLSRLPYETSEKDVQREFGVYGPIERIRVVRDKEGKSRGYAFLVYEKERDMRTAYKEAEGIKIGGRRIMVDVERGRTVKDWKPMRLGGGLGGATRKKKEPEPVVPFAAPGAFRGGFGGGRGGFRGGMRGGFAPRGGGFMGGAGRGGAPGGFGGPPGGGGFGAPRGGGGFGGPPGPGMGRGGFAQRGGFGQQSQMGGPPGGGFGAPPQGAGGGYVPRGGFGGGGGYGGGHEDGPPAKRGRY